MAQDVKVGREILSIPRLTPLTLRFHFDYDGGGMGKVGTMHISARCFLAAPLAALAREHGAKTEPP